MSEDNGDQQAFADALNGTGTAEMPEPLTASVEAPQGGTDDGQGAQPQPEPAAHSEPAPVAQRQDEGHIPSWRLREVQEERRQIAAEAAELRRWRAEREEQDRRREQEEALKTQDFYTAQDPNQFIDQRAQHVAREAMSPIQQQLTAWQQQQVQVSNYNSRLVAGTVYGADKVAAAEKAVAEALQSGDLSQEELARLNAAPNPFEAGVKWHQRHSTLQAIGGDLDTYNQRQQEAFLKDPAFLARALEAHRQIATPVQTGVPGGRAPQAPSRTALPSLNRQTSAQDDGGETDPSSVFADALATRGRRPG